MTVASSPITPSDHKLGPLRVEAYKILGILIGLALFRWQPHSYFDLSVVRWPLVALEVLGGSYFALGLIGSRLNLPGPGISRRANFLISMALDGFLVAGLSGMWTSMVGKIVLVIAGLLGGLLTFAMLSFQVFSLRQSLRSRVISPPGSTARSVLGFVYGKKIMERIFDPLIGDIQAEWLAHVVAGNIWHARMTRLRGYMEIGATVVANGGASFVDFVVKIYKLK